MPRRFRPASQVREELERLFPNLQQSKWYLRSPNTNNYRCISWAACEIHRTWWPLDCPREFFPADAYWPAHLPLGDLSIQNFVNAFVDDLGYEVCADDVFEWGYQKVAIYALMVNGALETKHMARQHLMGRGWLSKMGPSEDILHSTLSDLNGSIYGDPHTILRRHWRTAFKKGLAWPAVIEFCLRRSLHPGWVLSNLKERFS